MHQSISDLRTYCLGFARAAQAWPKLPLPDDPELSWWQELRGLDSDRPLQGDALLQRLETVLPQLLLPQVTGISDSDDYRRIVLVGETPAPEDLVQNTPWQQPQALRFFIAPHPCGAVPVLLTANRIDFDRLVRALAYRAEPIPLADRVHAQAISGLIHWGLMHRFGRRSRARLIVLHEAPYGSLCFDQVQGGLSEAAWLAASTKLRLEHELTHLATKRLLGEMRRNLLDELIADAMGMVAALGGFDAELFGRCLGIDDDSRPRTEVRWISYTRELSLADAHHALDLVLARACELESQLKQQPELLKPAQAMLLLRWLCQQRLDAPITPAPAFPR